MPGARLALAAFGIAATAAVAAPTPADFEACVERHPGEAGKAAREACFARLLSGAPPVPPAAPSALVASPQPPAAAAHEPMPKAQDDDYAVASQLNYFLPAFHSRHPALTASSPTRPPVSQGDRQATEAKFRLDLRKRVARPRLVEHDDLWIEYTQVSHWQMWNEEGSRPFRESSYEPQIAYTFRPAWLDSVPGGERVRNLGLALNHNSNGRGSDGSRSWNRIIAQAYFGDERANATLRGWWRIKEGDDDNPDIEDYYGRADLTLRFALSPRTHLTLMGRHSLRGGDRNHGAIQADLAFARPWTGDLRLHLQFFRGYAESLIDYNHLDTYWGIGFSLGSWH
jgi:phospholipase A1